MKSRLSFVSNSSSSSFLVPSRPDGRVAAMRLPEEIWKAIEKNYITPEGGRLHLSDESDEWWLTELVSDCMEEYGRISDMKNAHHYLEGDQLPYGMYDDGPCPYISFSRGGDRFYVDSADIAGPTGSRESLPEVLRLREAVQEVLSKKSIPAKQKLAAIARIFEY